LDNQNNYVEHLSVDDNGAKNFNILAISLNVLHNCFNDSNEIIFKSVCKFLDISAKLFFPCGFFGNHLAHPLKLFAHLWSPVRTLHKWLPGFILAHSTIVSLDKSQKDFSIARADRYLRLH